MPTPEPSSSTAARLDYALAPSRKKKTFRRIATILLIMAVSAGTWRWVPPAISRIQILYWQRQCINYAASPNLVVYEEEPKAGAALRQGDPHYTTNTLYRRYGMAGQTTSGATAYVPPCWWGYESVNGGGHSSAAVMFLHELVSPAGHHRLTLIRYVPSSSSFSMNFIPGYNVDVDLIAPATPFQVPARMGYDTGCDVKATMSQTAPNVRIYAGQLDPADRSHFTVRYEMWGKTDTLDGWLDDSDAVTLTARNTIWPPRP